MRVVNMYSTEAKAKCLLRAPYEADYFQHSSLHDMTNSITNIPKVGVCGR